MNDPFALLALGVLDGEIDELAGRDSQAGGQADENGQAHLDAV